jgi:hypothetical protein
MNAKDKELWNLLKTARNLFVLCCEAEKLLPVICRTDVLFLSPTLLEIYIFYRQDQGVREGESSGLPQVIRQRFLKELAELEYDDLPATEIRFIFDSDANVVKNFEGNYSYRLR